MKGAFGGQGGRVAGRDEVVRLVARIPRGWARKSGCVRQVVPDCVALAGAVVGVCLAVLWVSMCRNGTPSEQPQQGGPRQVQSNYIIPPISLILSFIKSFAVGGA